MLTLTSTFSQIGGVAEMTSMWGWRKRAWKSRFLHVSVAPLDKSLSLAQLSSEQNS